jgi:CDP-paratose 2-epimerase
VKRALITGSSGLIGSEAVAFFDQRGWEVHGIDNNMRRDFFGPDGDTTWNLERLRRITTRFTHHHLDIRDRAAMADVVRRVQPSLLVHCASQPSHDLAKDRPFDDFDVNATGTLNLLEAVRRHAPESPFIFMSTNKVYGDAPNALPLVERDTRWDYADPADVHGIAETCAIDACLHSLFGASKVAADVMVQEYGRYFGIPTVCYRGGCLTGPNHSGAELHGFLAYLARCVREGRTYRVYGYKGKQVRDAIHSHDLIRAFDEFARAPRVAEVYNIGGGRFSNASVIEAIDISQEIAGRELEWTYEDTNRVGDHIWWIGDNGRFEGHYPEWRLEYDVRRILEEIYEANVERWRSEDAAGARA